MFFATTDIADIFNKMADLLDIQGANPCRSACRFAGQLRSGTALFYRLKEPQSTNTVCLKKRNALQEKCKRPTTEDASLKSMPILTAWIFRADIVNWPKKLV
jgi:hypothetical protein